MKRAAPWIGFLTLAVAGPLIARLVPSSMTLSLLAQGTFTAIFALGIGFLIRQNGMISFGHAAFFGLPAYAFAALLPSGILPAEGLLLLAIAGTVAVAFIIGLIVVRVHGIAFGMLTLAIGQGLYEAATRWRSVTGGHDGVNVRLPREMFGTSLKVLQQPQNMFILAWIVMVLCLIAVWLFARSPWGQLTEAIRDNEERVRFLGYKTLLPRAAVFAGSAFLVAIAGSLSVLYNAFISPDSIHWTASGSGLIMAILGGTAAAWGPLLGGFVYFFLKHAAGAYTTHWLSIIGIALIFVAVMFPQGLAGLVQRRRSRA